RYFIRSLLSLAKSTKNESYPYGFLMLIQMVMGYSPLKYKVRPILDIHSGFIHSSSLPISLSKY
nr:hypothetical protein [Tanacetum cinerariifolium]